MSFFAAVLVALWHVVSYRAVSQVESLNEDDPLQETAFTYMAKYAVTNQNELLQLVSAILHAVLLGRCTAVRRRCASPLFCGLQLGARRT